MKKRQKTAIILTFIIIFLASIASLGGILNEELYQDNDFINRVWVGNDIITLLLAIPVMLISVILTINNSLKAKFIWIGSIWYMVYNYIFYMYGASFNKFFLLHVFLFIISVYAFILGLLSLDIEKLKLKLQKNTQIPFKRISAYMIFFGLFIGGMWIAMSLRYVFTNNVPEGITQTGHSTGVVFATDLSFVVSTLIVGAVLLWKKNVWGYIISSMLMVKCLLYPLVLVVGGLLAYQETGKYDSMTPGYVVLGLGCFICLWYLLKGLKTSE